MQTALNEFCAFLHSRVDIVSDRGLELRVAYDAHYCRHFARHPSQWTLQLSERYLKRLGPRASLEVDGQAERRRVSERQTITIPPGLGIHNVHLHPN